VNFWWMVAPDSMRGMAVERHSSMGWSDILF
jgi:hypothetical protein